MRKYLFVGVVGVLLSFQNATAQTTKQSWNLAYISAPKTVYQEVIDELPGRLAGLSGGTLDVHTTPSLVPPTEHLAAIKDGRIEAALFTNAYYSGEAPLLNIGGLPGVFNSLDEYRIANEKVLHERFAQLVSERYNAVYLLSGVWSGQAIWSREPIATAEAFKGQRVRAHNSETAQLMASLGARPIAMPLAEFIPALQRGVVDAGITGTMTGFGLGMPQVAKYINDWRIGYPSAWGLVVNRDVWERLPEETRLAIKEDMKVLEADIFRRVGEETESGIRQSVAEGATLIEPTEAEKEKVRAPELVQELYKKWDELNKRQGIEDGSAVLHAVNEALGR